MKLSDIILELKRIGKGTKTFKVPVYVPGRGNEVLEFEQLEIDFKFEDNEKLVNIKTKKPNNINRSIDAHQFHTAGVGKNFFKDKNSIEARILKIKDKIESGKGSEKDEAQLEKLEDTLLQKITKAEENTQDKSLLHYLLRWNVTLQNHLIPGEEKKYQKASGKRKENYLKSIAALKRESSKLTKLLEPYKKKYPRKFNNVSSASLETPSRIQPARNFIANTKGLRDIIDENPEYIVKPLPKFLRTLELKHKISLSDLLQTPTGTIAEADDTSSDSFYKNIAGKEVPTSTASGRELFLKVSEFGVNTSKLGYKMGIYTWVIDTEIRYVGLTTDTAKRPGNYGKSGAWTSAFGATADRVNAYITKRLNNITSREEAENAVKVYTAKLEPTPEVEKAYKEGKATGEITHGTFENWFKQSVLASVEGQVKGWAGNLGSGKVDVDNMQKVAQQRKDKDPKVNKGRGTYGRSGDINVDPISKAMDPDTGEDLFEK